MMARLVETLECMLIFEKINSFIVMEGLFLYNLYIVTTGCLEER
jgi:hypothetical protein